ncbi:MAG: hypothetical protein IKZ53_05900 [Selenomonadaceae bacterium]|nr:hypothetical protein [Selenomonadaceae bacterium]
MQKILMGIGVLLILLGIFGASYIWHYDHREAETLEKYAVLEFQVARDGDGNWESATLSLWDYRYDEARFLNTVIVFTDGAPWEIEAVTKQTQKGWRKENKLFFHFPKSSLKDLLLAKEIRIKFYYDNGQSIDLPLGKKELLAWQRKLRW